MTSGGRSRRAMRESTNVATSPGNPITAPATASRSASGRASERALLASAGVNVRSTEPAAHVRRLAWWSLLVAVLIALEYASRVSNGTPDRNVLYEYSTAIGSAAVYAVLLFIVV